MWRLRLYIHGRRAGAIAALLGSLAIAAAILSVSWTNDVWRKRSLSFAQQVNSLGNTLRPGGIGSLKVSASDADELILLPAYCSRIDLNRRFPDRPAAFIDRLMRVSGDDKNDHLIWLRRNRVISINPVKFTVGLNLEVQSWKVRAGREIRVKKELQSRNGFLSVYFLEDEVPE
jgi:hypothetical protein